jgi:2-deoxy-D-gluconate 3-dehydrogenase
MLENLFSLNGKVAVVTGGSRGIGAMIARGYLESGVKTYITSRSLDELQATANELSAIGECIAIQSDLSTMEGVQAFAEEIKAKEAQIHILVNNAGATWGAPIDEYPESGWDKVMNIFPPSMALPTLHYLFTPTLPARQR